MRLRFALPGLLAAALALPGAAGAASRLDLPLDALPEPFAIPASPPEYGAEDFEAAPLAMANPYVTAPAFEVRIGGSRKEPKEPRAAKSPRRPRNRRPGMAALTPERAQALLRSATVPGWGQATLGHRTSATIFGLLEAGVWGSFTAFRVQEHLRRESSTRTAQIYAGVDLHGKDEEFRRLVGTFASSDEYNLLVVTRDAANQFYDQPDLYRAYIAEHSLGGEYAWSWQDESSFRRYGGQRKDAHRAALRANTALAVAIGNRILSVLHAARTAGRSAAGTPAARHWNLEVQPARGDDPTAYRFGLRTRF